ncbi:MAG: hypothetical protein HYT27_00250 [Parcubacteria group bacterium]|nr:hypothetical protein [Parcubacteria group bacterium]
MPKFESFSPSGKKPEQKKRKNRSPSKKSGGSGLSGSGAGPALGGLIEFATLGLVSPPSEKRKKSRK